MRSRRADRLGGRFLEKETIGRQTGDAKGGERRRGAWRDGDREARGDCFGDELIAWIGNQRSSSVRNERQSLPFGDASKCTRPTSAALCS